MMPDEPATTNLQTEAGVASAEEGLVVLDGPDGVAVTMTAGAATQTGESLISAAETAEQQAAAMAPNDPSAGYDGTA